MIRASVQYKLYLCLLLLSPALQAAYSSSCSGLPTYADPLYNDEPPAPDCGTTQVTPFEGFTFEKPKLPTDFNATYLIQVYDFANCPTANPLITTNCMGTMPAAEKLHSIFLSESDSHGNGFEVPCDAHYQGSSPPPCPSGNALKTFNASEIASQSVFRVPGAVFEGLYDMCPSCTTFNLYFIYARTLSNQPGVMITVVQEAATPEPSSILLLSTGALFLGFLFIRNRVRVRLKC